MQSVKGRKYTFILQVTSYKRDKQRDILPNGVRTARPTNYPGYPVSCARICQTLLDLSRVKNGQVLSIHANKFCITFLYKITYKFCTGCYRYTLNGKPYWESYWCCAIVCTRLAFLFVITDSNIQQARSVQNMSYVLEWHMNLVNSELCNVPCSLHEGLSWLNCLPMRW